MFVFVFVLGQVGETRAMAWVRDALWGGVGAGTGTCGCGCGCEKVRWGGQGRRRRDVQFFEGGWQQVC